MGLRAGALGQRITLQQRTVAQDPTGGQLAIWTDVATVWAEVVPLSGRELIAAQAVASETSHQITLRWQPAFADAKAVTAMRVVMNGRYFNISAAINEDERNRTLVLLVAEGANDG